VEERVVADRVWLLDEGDAAVADRLWAFVDEPLANCCFA